MLLILHILATPGIIKGLQIRFAMKYYNILNSVSFFLQPSSQVQKAKISPTSDEHVLDQLSQCEVKLLKVLEELDGKELDDVVKEMEDEDVSIE